MPKLKLRPLTRSVWRPMLALALFAFGCGTAPFAGAQGPPAPAVGGRTAEIREVTRSYEFVGRISAINTVQLRARVEGYLDKVLFTEGQDVKIGEPLYQIEKALYQAQVDQAKADVAAAEAVAI